uniref:carbonic anhydrase 15-like n=1 Tax=Ictidomys tridecemlineatus TaxID=43179 RepID=UPI001A9F73C8|nr:carbonic anhydrase 15-like [Ictidomys tridecemlineatus]
MQALGCVLLFLAVQQMVPAYSEGTWCYDSQDPKCGSTLWTLDLVPLGPTHWKELAPACGGPTQSPINIDLHLVQKDSTLQPFIFQGYNLAPPGPWSLENDGHTVLLHMDTGLQNGLEIWGAGLPPPAYRALQLHFHWGAPGHTGSEHSLDGQRYSMEMHIVHINKKYQSMEEARRHPDGLAVLAVLLAEQDQDNANFSAIVLGLKNVSIPGVSVNMTSTFPLSSLLPSPLGLLRYYRYSGSLTTPGCEPSVLWTVFENAVPIGRVQVGSLPLPWARLPTSDGFNPPLLALLPPHLNPSFFPLNTQVAQFQTVPQAGMLGLHPEPLTDNFRPLQPLGGRSILASPKASIRAAAPPGSPILAGVHRALLVLGLSLVVWQDP